MRIYLPGPPCEDLKNTAALLTERGYRVVTSADMANPKYPLNRGYEPTARQCRLNQTHEMMLSDCVVLSEELDIEERYDVVQACRYMGLPVVEYAALPALAPGCGCRDEVVRCIDLTEPLVDEEEQTLEVSALSVWLDRVADGFNKRFGWFFTNGNKAQQPVRYQHGPQHLTTT